MDIGQSSPLVVFCVLSTTLWMSVDPARGVPNAEREQAVHFDSLCRQAQERAKRPFVSAAQDLPQVLRDLDYDGYRAITYRPQRALWLDEKLPFRVEFFHRGYLFPKRVRVSVLNGAVSSEVPFSPGLFDYSNSRVEAEQLRTDLGFAGFRVLHPIHQPDHHHEFISFLGASYFRAVAAHQVYGASARGLAVGMGSPNEEFPFFDAFWIAKPSADARTITVCASLDGPSVVGAYRFEISPGAETTIDVQAEIFARTTLNAVGVAPVTSMYFYGRNGPRRLQGSRAEVHDSDGLLIDNGSGEWIWRPLWNPATLSLSSFELESVRGFGLIQRARDPCDYNDPHTSYEKRPSVWVEPSAPWRGGAIQLLELPSNGEGQDNIGACWLPPANARAGDSLSIGYRMRFGKSPPEPDDIGKVAATRWSESPGPVARFQVDFDLGSAGLDPQHPPEAVVSADAGRISQVQTRRDPSEKYWRVTFEAGPPTGRIMEMRALLKRDGRTLTEIWSFPWPH